MTGCACMCESVCPCSCLPLPLPSPPPCVCDVQSLQKKAASAADPECTFNPSINPRSKQLKGRSVVEMSRGDMLRRESAQRLMRLRAEQAQLDGLTFQPTINPASREIEGRLKISSDADTYLERVQLEAKIFSDRQRKATQEAEMQECVSRVARAVLLCTPRCDGASPRSAARVLTGSPSARSGRKSTTRRRTCSR